MLYCFTIDFDWKLPDPKGCILAGLLVLKAAHKRIGKSTVTISAGMGVTISCVTRESAMHIIDYVLEKLVCTKSPLPSFPSLLNLWD